MKFLKEEANRAYLRGEWEKAIEYFKIHCINNPKDLKSRLTVAGLLERSGKKEEAAKIYKRLVDDYHQEGFLQQAISISKIILRIDPFSDWAHVKLVKLYAEKEVVKSRQGY